MLRHYRAFIVRRRAQRPSQEYREPTAAEWAEFEQHFTRRKVERPALRHACRHEHACIRYPMLHPDPPQEPRLAAIIANLEDRIGKATDQGWLGEVDDLLVSLASARQKLEQMRKLLSQPPVVPLGNPGFGGPEQARSHDRAGPPAAIMGWPARPSTTMPACTSTNARRDGERRPIPDRAAHPWSATLDVADHAALDPGVPDDLDRHPDVGVAADQSTRA